MIPFFRHKKSWDALEKVHVSKVVKKSEWPKGVVEDLKNYDESIFFFKGKRPFVFED